MNKAQNINQTQLDTTHITTSRNPESGSKVAACPPQQTVDSDPPKWAGRWSNLGPDHLKRWEKRLYFPKSGGSGQVVEAQCLAVRIQHLGKREEFRFKTTNRQAAAAQALDVFRFLKANGWKETLTKFKPDADAPKVDVTIGDFLTAISNTKRFRSRTFLSYQNGLRTIASEVFNVKLPKGVSKFDYRSGGSGEQSGHAKWLEKIDSHRLEKFTPELVTAWKRKRITQAGHSPAAAAAAKRTVNSYIRCARSLFSPSVLREIKQLTLPTILPFAGVELEEAGSMKYVSKLSAQTLIAAARLELKSDDIEVYKVFLLGLFAGLRKAEIDLLEWRMIDFATNVIRLEQTEWLHLKTEDSAAEITIDPEVLTELAAFKPALTDNFAWSQFILVSNRPPRPESLRPYYRCDETFDRLTTWLRSKGITANKPLHELRKELGALIATDQGIYAASKFLRHSDITTTARHYADHKQRISVGLGKFLDTGIKPVEASQGSGK